MHHTHALILRSCVEGMCCCTMWWASWRRRKAHGVMWREAWVRCLRPSPALLDLMVQTFSLRRYSGSEAIVMFRLISRFNWHLHLRPNGRMWNRSWWVQTVQQREWCWKMGQRSTAKWCYQMPLRMLPSGNLLHRYPRGHHTHTKRPGTTINSGVLFSL